MNGLYHLTRVLLPWYDRCRRSLPWREDVTPYRTWVSEIMLQQTRVQAVLPYFQRFMEAAPDVPSLAALPEERLLGLWQGLGYYSRARNLQKAAKIITQEHGGRVPDSYEALRHLPGIGDYTAGAILSIAWGQPVPAVDGNVLRIAARVTDCRDNVLDDAVRKTVRQAVAAVLPADRPGDFNQALMDLGALVCLPGEPLCGECPAAEFCAACRQGCQRELPVREKPAGKRREPRTVFLLRRDGATALRRREDTGLLAGLWEFPNAAGTLTETDAAALLERWNVTPRHWLRRSATKHVFTHVVWELTVYELEVQGPGASDWVWCPPEGRDDFPMPTAFRKLET